MERKFMLHNSIRKFRKHLGMTQTDLSKAVGVSKNAISSIENHVYSPSACLAFRLCQALDCSFEDLFFLVIEND